VHPVESEIVISYVSGGKLLNTYVVAVVGAELNPLEIE
jgi:hypothetical protein